jgi:hypothetical protein
MKFDMSGAARVLGLFQSLAMLKPAVNVVGLIPACENLINGKAVKPGDVYIEDRIVGQMGLSSAIDAACSLYIRNGRVEILGIEKVANDTTYEHIRKGLVARGRYLSIKKKGKYGGNLLLLSPEGRGKNYRIEAALSWPLNNGKLHYVDDLCDEVVFSFQEECSKFPLWHVDNLDCLAYLYDILADPTSTYMFQTEVDEDDDLELENESVPKYY